jgi:hypothetical protein
MGVSTMLDRHLGSSHCKPEHGGPDYASRCASGERHFAVQLGHAELLQLGID